MESGFDWPGWITAGAAIVAVGISLFSLWKSGKVDALQHRLNQIALGKEQALDVEKKKAKFDAIMQKSGRNWHLIVKTVGKSEARNVRVGLLDPNTPILPSDIERKFPRKNLGPSKTVEVMALPGFSTSDGGEIKTIWDDDFATDREEIIAL